MLIAQLSDTHILAQATDQPAAELRADCLQRAVADINAHRPDAVIFTGDTTQHGAPEEYERLRALLEPLEAPVYVVPGNRDDNETLRVCLDNLDYLPAAGGFLHYTIDTHPIRLVALDSTTLGERKGRFCEARQAWLNETLAARPDVPTLLFIHHPPFDVDDHYIGGYRQPDEARGFAGVVENHPQVRGLICGHVHWLVECEWVGRPARIMPSIAVDLRKGVDESVARQRPIYLLHTLTADGELVTESRLA